MSINTTWKTLHCREANRPPAEKYHQSKRNFTTKKKARQMKRKKIRMLIIQKVRRQYIVMIILTQLVIQIHDPSIKTVTPEERLRKAIKFQEYR